MSLASLPDPASHAGHVHCFPCVLPEDVRYPGLPDTRPAHLVCRCGAQLATNAAPVRSDDGTLHTSDACLSQMDRIEAQLESLMVAHNDMVEKVNTVMAQVTPHLDTIGPMLDNIATHPMMRMFTGGK